MKALLLSLHGSALERSVILTMPSGRSRTPLQRPSRTHPQPRHVLPPSKRAKDFSILFFWLAEMLFLKYKILLILRSSFFLFLFPHSGEMTPPTFGLFFWRTFFSFFAVNLYFNVWR